MSLQTEIARLKNATTSMKSAITAKGVTVPSSARISDLAQYIALIAGGQRAKFAVTDDISNYSSTAFVDVYDRATDKWYKLNDQNQFEEYGIYGTSLNDTKYVGKLVVVNGYEYEWNGTSWDNLGEVTGGTVTYTYPTYMERPNANGGCFDLGRKFTENTVIQIKHSSTASGDAVIIDIKDNDNDDWRVFGASGTRLYYDFSSSRISKSSLGGQFTPNIAEWEIGNYYVKDMSTGSNLVSGTAHTGFTRPCNMYLYANPNTSGSYNDYGKVYYVKIYENNVLVRHYVPWTSNGTLGFADIKDTSDITFYPVSGTWVASTAYDTMTVGSITRPEDYTTKTTPQTTVTFATMAEAELYIDVYYGLYAYINGSLYQYTSNEEWVAVSYTLSGTMAGNNPMSLMVNGTDYNMTVGSAVDESTYTWSYNWDTSTPVTSIAKGTTNYASLKTIDWSQLNTSQWTSIVSQAFKDCTNLALTSLPSTVTSIGWAAFDGCTNITLTSLPSGLTFLGQYAFDGCTNITLTSLPSGLTEVRERAFRNCSSITVSSIPSGVTTLGMQAFVGCTSITSMTLPASLTAMNGSFRYCNKLKTVTCYATTPPSDSGSFYDCHADLVIYVPAASVDAYKTASGWSAYADRIQAIP